MTAVLPMPGSERMRAAVPAALRLVGAVRAGDAVQARAILLTADASALCIALASLVDDKQSERQLLAWTTGVDAELDGWSWRQVLDAHNSYEQWRLRGLADQVPPAVREGERIYSRTVKRRQRRQRQAQAES